MTFGIFTVQEALTLAERIFGDMDGMFWMVNLGIPLLVLGFNLCQRGLFKVGTASASSDWILLLVGLDFATAAVMFADGGAKLAHQPANLGVWILAMIAGGYAAYSFSLKVIEPKIVRAVEHKQNLPAGTLKHQRAIAFCGVLWMYSLSLTLPLISTSVHILAYSIKKA